MVKNDDLRSRAKVPYGYRIVEGKAVIDPEEAGRLKKYFEGYLSGLPMTGAARMAQLPYTRTNLPHLFSRKEYLGTDFYPPLISKEYQEKLVTEWKKRKDESPRKPENIVRKAVRIYTNFQVVIPEEEDVPQSTVEYLAILYRRIIPAPATVNT